MASVGETVLATGWTEEYAGANGQVKAWLVVRGWESMEQFQEAVGSEEFKEGSPILFGWGAPFELVSS
jgi:hypothetical protein